MHISISFLDSRCGKRFLLSIPFVVFSCSVFAQGSILIDHKTKRFLGEVSALDRDKFTNVHNVYNDVDPEFEAFKETYNISPDYSGSRQFWNPMNKVNDGVIPSVPDNYDGVREVLKGRVGTGRESRLFFDETLDYSQEDVSQFSLDLADYIARSYRDEWDPMHEFIEPFNEPMVHAKDYYPGGFNSAKNDLIITKMCEFHRDLGQAIRTMPELVNLKMMGYASAFPEFESNDFDLWNKRYKKFIDIAGEDMDIFSVHLYDGSGINNTGGRRSGSNAVAILDLIEAYSFIKLGVAKPVAVTEFGRLVANQPGWANGNGVKNYEPVENSQATRSQLHMVMDFIEREDNFELALPFNTNQREPTTQFSKATLFTTDDSGNVVLTPRRFFYEMLSDLKGERVRILSTNVDVQILAFVEGSELYVMLNNLNDDSQNIALQMLDLEGLTEVEVKRLKVFLDKTPELSTTIESTAPAALTLEYGETVVLTYKFDSDISFENTITRTKYYGTEYLKPIAAGSTLSFTFTDVEVGEGDASLRFGIGRSHGLSLRPTVSLNGSTLSLPTDLIRGYDQLNRSSFFGTLEIPFDISLLQEGTNTIELSFDDNGGFITSAIMEVEVAENEVEEPELPLGAVIQSDLVVYPNPVVRGEKVTITSSSQVNSISIFDASGRLIQVIEGDELETKDLRQGFYYLQVQAGSVVESRKLLIQ
ncbi:MAG: T9SS type A sorting domain-containing protein [Bacteroidota bacterium]